jgi:hypothetical protein
LFAVALHSGFVSYSMMTSIVTGTIQLLTFRIQNVDFGTLDTFKTPGSGL